MAGRFLLGGRGGTPPAEPVLSRHITYDEIHGGDINLRDRVIQMYAPKLACGFIIFPVLIWDYNPQLTLNPPRKDRVLDDGPTPFKGTPAKSLGGPSSKQDKYVTVEYFGRSYKTLRPGLNWAGCTLAALTHWFYFWVRFGSHSPGG